jgi:hypothetical protein
MRRQAMSGQYDTAENREPADLDAEDVLEKDEGGGGYGASEQGGDVEGPGDQSGMGGVEDDKDRGDDAPWGSTNEESTNE